MDREHYQAVYDYSYANDPGYGWGHGLWTIPEVVDFLDGFDNPVLLDCGCGRLQYCRGVREKAPGIKVYGLDIHVPDEVPEGIHYVHAPVWDLSEVVDAPQVIVSMDVLEHLYEEDVDRTIAAWADKIHSQGRLLLTIATVPDYYKGPGFDCRHPTVKPGSWWQAQFARYFTAVTVEEIDCDGTTGVLLRAEAA